MLLIRNVTIIDPESNLHQKQRDVLVKDGMIHSIRSTIKEAKAKVLEASGACLSIGWLDIGVQVGDPGYEHREDINSVSAAAAAGGYTGIACQPNTSPVIHSKPEILYLKNNSKHQLPDFFSLGAISRNCEGLDITEMIDMHHAGALAFSDGKNPVQDSGLMMRALQYVKAFEGLVINQPHDHALSPGGQIHEGVISTSLGMRGFSDLSEEMMLIRDLNLLEYTDSRLHVANVSSRKSVKLIQEAKQKGLKVTASVPIMNLIFEDAVMLGFDSNFKVLPPLREKQDIKALVKAVKKGIIDCITTNHVPLEEEAKNLEFPYAKFGAIGLETTYALYNTHLADKLTTEDIVRLIAVNPRKILGIPIPQIKEGTNANLTVFHPEKEWTFDKSDIYSKSHNTPFVGHRFKGKVLAVLNKGMIRLFE